MAHLFSTHACDFESREALAQRSDKLRAVHFAGSLSRGHQQAHADYLYQGGQENAAAGTKPGNRNPKLRSMGDAELLAPQLPWRRN
jgi:hypothetical protein